MLALLVLAGAASLGAAPAVAQTAAAEIQAKARAVVADPRYQRELPPHSEDPPEETPDERALRIHGEPGSVAVPAIGAGASLARIVFIVLLAVAAALVLGWLVRSFAARSQNTDESATAGPDADAQAREREPDFQDASRLAAEGRYAEAIHALLLATIRHFAERSRTPIQPSKTSRELVRLLPLRAETREAFAELVGTVERSLFGGVAVDRDDYETSLARFRALTRRPA
ncbi:MAG TPA: DUF4129 domain-containing protein [Thermoanaerobaculia bacterium]|nr:DUF4129 domain-containing protein [Thermoanaerobaculia bacterium]